MKNTSKNEDNLQNEGNLKNEDDLKNEDNLKYENDLKNEDNLKKKTLLLFCLYSVSLGDALTTAAMRPFLLWLCGGWIDNCTELIQT